MEGHSGPSKGRRSSQKLADHLRSFEELGLIRRDNARDAVYSHRPRRPSQACRRSGLSAAENNGERTPLETAGRVPGLQNAQDGQGPLEWRSRIAGR